MSAPPCRVVILGNSIPLFVAPPRVSRAEATYGEWVERLLWAEGLPTTVDNRARYNGMLPQAICDFASAVRAGQPDVVVLHYGMAEVMPRLMPAALHQALHTHHQHGGWGRVATRQLMLRRAWPLLRRWQQQADQRFDDRWCRVPPARFRHELHHLLYLTRREVAPLVLVLGTYPPGTSQRYWLPRAAERALRFDAIMDEVSAEYDDVHFVPAQEMLDRVTADTALPDGFHLSATGHRVVAQLLVDRILPWTQKQPHLVRR